MVNYDLIWGSTMLLYDSFVLKSAHTTIFPYVGRGRGRKSFFVIVRIFQELNISVYIYLYQAIAIE